MSCNIFPIFSPFDRAASVSASAFHAAHRSLYSRTVGMTRRYCEGYCVAAATIITTVIKGVRREFREILFSGSLGRNSRKNYDIFMKNARVVVVISLPFPFVVVSFMPTCLSVFLFGTGNG